MKRLFYLPFFLVFFLGLGLTWFYINVKPVSTNKTFFNFVVNKGASASQIGTNLEKNGLIKSALAFKIYVEFTGQASKIQVGEFSLSPSYNLFQIVTALQSGPLEVWVTIPEGFRREEVAAKFAESLGKDKSFFNDFLELSKNYEGMLFPDTYLFPKDASPSAIVGKLVKNFENKTASLKASDSLSFEENIILASIIERETKNDGERPIVAGILINRLNAGMPLQVDASVQFAIANENCKFKLENCDWWSPPTKADLLIASPFNTYKFVGLPPTPIANPGITSLEAAFSPSQTDYYYYIHDNSGQIHYAKTLEEQNANVARYLQ